MKVIDFLLYRVQAVTVYSPTGQSQTLFSNLSTQRQMDDWQLLIFPGQLTSSKDLNDYRQFLKTSRDF